MFGSVMLVKPMAEFRRSLNRTISLARRKFLLPRPAGFFEPHWYLKQYPDVAGTGMDPWMHFHLHGRGEGRFAHPAHLEMWFDDAAFDKVIGRFRIDLDALSRRDYDYFQWLLARRLAWDQRWADIIDIFEPDDLERHHGNPSGLRHVPGLLYADALRHSGREQDSKQVVEWLVRKYPSHTDIRLIQANHILEFGDRQQLAQDWLAAVNSIYAAAGLRELDFIRRDSPSLEAIGAQAPTAPGERSSWPDANRQPLVSVLMAAHNAETTIGHAIRSVLEQTWQALELIVVDDGSDDATAECAGRAAAGDPRFRVLRSEQKRGPYAARNQALATARGDFITLHDADDWSHPQKIELQVRELLADQSLMATFSDWVRTSGKLVFGTWRMPSSWLGWVHRNTSSLMFRRAVHERLGYWDEVNCNADVEFVDRLTAVWGSLATRAVVPGIPMAFARLDSSSLTQRSKTNVISSLKGLRHDYARAYSAWHANARTAGDLYLPSGPRERPFPAPAGMLMSEEN